MCMFMCVSVRGSEGGREREEGRGGGGGEGEGSEREFLTSATQYRPNDFLPVSLCVYEDNIDSKVAKISIVVK